MERSYAALVSLALLGAMVSPALRDPPVDSFPLSDYPMFSLGRPSPLLDVTHALGVGADGERRALPPLLSAANREVLQSMVTLHRAVQGAPGAAPHCAEVAERVAADPAFADVVAVELATSRFDTVRYLARGETAPLGRRIHHRCAVRRPASAGEAAP
ncbi:MAG: hypothetical protein AAF447_15205 [Myxococcota bacterium]